MKAEHRHELKTNVLADTMGRLLQGMRSGPSRHELIVLGTVVVVAVVVVLGYYLYTINREARSALWLKVDEAEGRLNNAANPDEVQETLKDFEKTADANADTVPARVLRFERARTLLRQGTEHLYAEHDGAVKDLEEARATYAKLADETKEPVLVQEALMGVAKADESLGKLDKALEGYLKLAGRYPSSPLGKAAKERADYLEKNHDQVKELYAKLEGLAKSPLPPPVKPEEKK